MTPGGDQFGHIPMTGAGQVPETGSAGVPPGGPGASWLVDSPRDDPWKAGKTGWTCKMLPGDGFNVIDVTPPNAFRRAMLWLLLGWRFVKEGP